MVRDEGSHLGPLHALVVGVVVVVVEVVEERVGPHREIIKLHQQPEGVGVEEEWGEGGGCGGRGK